MALKDRHIPRQTWLTQRKPLSGYDSGPGAKKLSGRLWRALRTRFTRKEVEEYHDQ